MNYFDYFKGKFRFPKAGVIGKESDWLELGEINVPRGLLWVGDASVITPREGCAVEVPPGRYRVEVKGMDFKGARVPSRARAFAKGARGFRLGARRGEAITDTAQIAICDIREMQAVVTKRHSKEFESDLLAQISETHISVQTFDYGKRSLDIAFVASGFSDGAYDVYVLESGRKAVGVETEFLPPGYKME